MNVIGHQAPFFDSTLLLRRQLAEHLSKLLPQLSVQRAPSAFRDENDLKFAVSCRVAQTFELVHRGSSFRVLGGSRLEVSAVDTPQKCQTFTACPQSRAASFCSQMTQQAVRYVFAQALRGVHQLALDTALRAWPNRLKGRRSTPCNLPIAVWINPPMAEPSARKNPHPVPSIHDTRCSTVIATFRPVPAAMLSITPLVASPPGG